MRMFLAASIAPVALLAVAGAMSGEATAALPAPPTKAAVTAACHPGRDPQQPGNDNYPGGLSISSGGLTPIKLPGAITVSVEEARCVIDRYGTAVTVIAAMDESERLANSYSAVVSGSNGADEQKQVVDWLAKVTEGRKDRPLIIYCHHERCFLSYNLALRAVQADYSQVYWMRSGISSWTKAGYALAPKPPVPPRPGEQTVSSRVAGNVAECYDIYADESATDWATMVRQIPIEAEHSKQYGERLQKAREEVAQCIAADIRGAQGAADRAAYQKAKDGSATKVSAIYSASWREMEANPAKYLAPWDQPAELRESLRKLQAFKSLDQTCGDVDLTQPQIGPDYNAANRRRIDRMNSFVNCINAYDEKPSLFSERNDIETANKWARAVRRYTCGAGWKVNCIPSDPYNSIARLADQSALALVKRIESMADQSGARYRALRAPLAAWEETYHQRVNAYNASH